MKILLIADGRSPITQRWIKSVSLAGHRIILVSSYPCERPDAVAEFFIVPIAFANYAGNQAAGHANVYAAPKGGFKRKLIKKFRSVFMKARYYVGPLSCVAAAKKIEPIIRRTEPDLIHALRIPFEGMVAALCAKDLPLALSIWGNDLTLHANGSSVMAQTTRNTLHRADGLIADATRDIRLGKMWGFAADKPALVVPGNGGIDFTEIRMHTLDDEQVLGWLPSNRNLVINPRGFRPGSVRNDTFFKSIPLILQHCPDTVFICCAMAGQPEALEWVNKLGIQNQMVLLPMIPQRMLWGIFNQAKVSVSVSQHDGTPNSLLEAMTCGCFPIAGDIESTREWITPGVNGMLVDPDNEEQLAEAVCIALKEDDLRIHAAQINDQLVRSRAEISMVSLQIALFYEQVRNG